MGRKPCCEKVGLKRGPWTSEEDQKLVSYITSSGICCWRAIPKLAGLLRCGKSCRLRWTNYLRPDLKRGIFSEEEENLILDLHSTLGNRWSRIAAQLPGRTDNEIKNYWNTRLKKRLRSQGLDPNTHLPFEDSKQADGTDGEDGDSSDATMSESKSRKSAKAQEPKVRQPKGPKPAPQLKMCQSKEGPVLLKVPKSPKSPTSVIPGVSEDSEPSTSCSTGANSFSTEDHQDSIDFVRKLTSVPSFPEAELWKCIKPIASAPTPAALLSEWETHRVDRSLLLNSLYIPKFGEVDKPAAVATLPQTPQAPQVPQVMDSVMETQFNSEPAIEVGENFSGMFQSFAPSEMSLPWTMDAEMGHDATPESLFAPSIAMNPITCYFGTDMPVQQSSAAAQSPELQRLAALLDLI